MVLWAVAIVGVLVAGAAWARAGKTARKLEALNQSYWELRYDYVQLRSRLAQLQPPDPTASPAQDHATPGQTAFVPLSSLKR